MGTYLSIAYCSTHEAAPKLLEALNVVATELEDCAHCPEERWRSALDQALDAIAHAENGGAR